jgi:hypothetical protein
VKVSQNVSGRHTGCQRQLMQVARCPLPLNAMFSPFTVTYDHKQ